MPHYLQAEEAGPGVRRQQLLHVPVEPGTVQPAAGTQHQRRHPGTTLVACGRGQSLWGALPGWARGQ